MNTNELYTDALELLKKLIAKPSFSGHEEGTANLIESFLQDSYVFTTASPLYRSIPITIW